MRSVFDAVPEGLFSLLAARNRRVYFKALMVLRDCYRFELRFRRTDLATYIMHDLENELLTLEPDDMAEGATTSGAVFPSGQSDEAAEGTAAAASVGSRSTGDAEPDTISARAYTLIRRLVETGWLKAVPDDQSLDELLLVPPYASTLLETLWQLANPQERPYNSYVYSTYSALKTAHEERGEYMYPALQAAHDNTQALLESLRALLHGIHEFYEHLRERRDIRDLLAEHFDEYQLQVALKTYHPLKTVDSVHRFRPRIVATLRQWLQDGAILEQLASSLCVHKSGFSESDARYECIRMMDHILETFGSMDEVLGEIDRRNARYSRAAVDRIQYLLNADRDVRGKLIEILKAVPSLSGERGAATRQGNVHEGFQTTPALPADDADLLVKRMSEVPFFRPRFTDTDSLYREPKRRERSDPQPLRATGSVSAARFAAEAQELMTRIHSLFSPEELTRFLVRSMTADGIVRSEDLRIHSMDDFLRTMIAVIRADEPDFPFLRQWAEQQRSVSINGYGIPALSFMRTDKPQPT